MKRKGFSKLILAGVGLAATAATLTTATYAWYVSNSEVKANGVVGSVKSDASGSLYIAKNVDNSGNYSPAKYNTEINFATADYSSDELSPQSLYTAATTYNYSAASSYVAGTTYYTKSETYSAVTSINSAETYAAAAATGALYTRSGSAEPYTYTPATGYVAETTYYQKGADKYTAASITEFAPETTYYTRAIDYEQNKTFVKDDGTKTTATLVTFKYWLKASSDGYVNLQLTVDNTTQSAAGLTQQAFETTGLPTGVGQGDAFIVDAVHALRMSVTKTVYDTTITKADDTYTKVTDSYVDGTAYYTQDANLSYKTVAVANAEEFATAKAAALGTTLYTRSGESPNYTYAAADSYVASTQYYVAYNTYTLAPITEFETGVDYYTRTVGASTSSYAVAATGQDATQRHIYQVDQIALGKTGSKYFTEGSTAYATNGVGFALSGANTDANKYYTAITGKTPYNTAATTGASNDASTGDAAWPTITGTDIKGYELAANKDTLFEFEIWLEGSDKECFDSCRGQDFSFDFKIGFTEKQVTPQP